MMFLRYKQITYLVSKVFVIGLVVVCYTHVSDAGVSRGGGILWQSAPLSIPNNGQQGPKGGLWLQPQVPVKTGSTVEFTAHAYQPAFGHLYAINPSGRIEVLARNYPLGMNYGYGQHGMLQGQLAAQEPSGSTELVLLLTYRPLNEAMLNHLAGSQGRRDYVQRLTSVLARIASGQWSSYRAAIEVHSRIR